MVCRYGVFLRGAPIICTLMSQEGRVSMRMVYCFMCKYRWWPLLAVSMGFVTVQDHFECHTSLLAYFSSSLVPRLLSFPPSLPNPLLCFIICFLCSFYLPSPPLTPSTFLSVTLSWYCGAVDSTDKTSISGKFKPPSLSSSLTSNYSSDGCGVNDE